MDDFNHQLSLSERDFKEFYLAGFRRVLRPIQCAADKQLHEFLEGWAKFSPFAKRADS
jgi:hypothetical protein